MVAQTRRSRAFTLVELLVVMAVISTLMTILLPAVNHVREVARRAICASNMRQIALACNAYHTTFNAFPCGQVGCPPSAAAGVVPTLMFLPGSGCTGPNWLGLIQAQLGENMVWDSIRTCANSQGDMVKDGCSKAGGYDTNRTRPPAFMLCPSAPEMTGSNNLTANNMPSLLKGNYAACWGMEGYYNKANEPLTPNKPTGKPEWYKGQGLYALQLDGIFNYVAVDPPGQGVVKGYWKLGHGKGTRIDYLVDGVSRTMLVSEVIGYDSSADCRGAWYWGGMGASAFTAKLPPNSGHTKTTSNGPESLSLVVDGTNLTFQNVNDNIPICDTNISAKDRYSTALVCTKDAGATAYASARSAHIGGVNIVMADCSTRFISDTISLFAWKAISTKNGIQSEEVKYPVEAAY